MKKRGTKIGTKHSETLMNRFCFRMKDAVEKTSSCWLWHGSLDSYGYGKIYYGHRSYRAHRLSYIFYIGDISKKDIICHKCDNRKCVNPDHLFLGTQKDNVMDMIKKNRMPIGEKRGNAKLNENKIRNILSFRGKKTHKELANEFGVCRQLIGRIINGKTWKHLTIGVCNG